MSKIGNATKENIAHGVEGSEQWEKDQRHNKKRSKKNTWILFEKADYEVFKSDISGLRPDAQTNREDKPNWGYFSSKGIYGEIEACSTNAFETNLNSHKEELSSYYEITFRKNHRDKKSYPQAQKRNARKGKSFLKRITIDVSPEISRGLELSFKGDSEALANAQIDLQEALPEIIKMFEATFKGAKVTAAAWHVKSGQLHCDLWVHGCSEKEVEIGKRKKLKKLQVRDHTATYHFGAGSGIVAWDRHVRVLGDEAQTIATATALEVDSAIELAEARSVMRNRKGTANRDIAVHRGIDEIVAPLVEKSFLKQATDQYKDHLRNMYLIAQAGPDLNKDTKAVRITKLAKQAQQALADLNETRKLHSEAEQLRAESEAAKESAQKDLNEAYSVLEEGIQRCDLANEKEKLASISSSESDQKLKEAENERQQLEADKAAFQTQQEIANASLTLKTSQLDKRSQQLEAHNNDLTTRESELANSKEELARQREHAQADLNETRRLHSEAEQLRAQSKATKEAAENDLAKSNFTLLKAIQRGEIADEKEKQAAISSAESDQKLIELENERQQFETDKSVFHIQREESNANHALRTSQLDERTQDLEERNKGLDRRESILNDNDLLQELVDLELNQSVFDIYTESKEQDFRAQQNKIKAFDLAKPIINKILRAFSKTPKVTKWLFGKCGFTNDTFKKLAEAFDSKWSPTLKKEDVCRSCHKSPCGCGGKTNI